MVAKFFHRTITHNKLAVYHWLYGASLVVLVVKILPANVQGAPFIFQPCPNSRRGKMDRR